MANRQFTLLIVSHAIHYENEGKVFLTDPIPEKLRFGPNCLNR